jgi:putative colanic acid biosynthesis UDP-glucose lipid carrier transferase
MSRRSLATASQATTVDPASLVEPPVLRIPYRMVLDILMLLEVGLVVVSAALAKVLYIAFFLDSQQDHQQYLMAGLAGGIVLHYMMRLRGLHEPAAYLGWRRRLGEFLITIGLSFLVLIALAYLLKISADYSRGWLLTWLALVSLTLLLSRPASARLLRWLATTGYTARRIAVVASGATGLRLAESLRQAAGVRVVGVFDEPGRDGQNKPRASIADLISIGQRNQIDEVVIALSNAPQPRTERLIDELSVLPVDVWLCPAEFDMPILGTSRLGALSLLQVKPKPIRDWGYVIKLTLDYVLGAISLIVFAPLMLAVALAIKLESRGPVFFKQRRHGYNHRLIHVYKFRTMHAAEDGAVVVQARKDDDRITRVGKFLRRTSIDELPQLFNVLKGEMSLVGPRPHAVSHNQLYCERLERYANRHCVKPGMTGWAQIHGFRGPTEDPEKMRKRVQMDLYYIENWSISLDLKIIALTPFVGFVHRNAF